MLLKYLHLDSKLSRDYLLYVANFLDYEIMSIENVIEISIVQKILFLVSLESRKIEKFRLT